MALEYDELGSAISVRLNGSTTANGGAAPVAGIESKNRSAPRSQNKRPNRIFSSVCKLGSQKMFLRRVLR